MLGFKALAAETGGVEPTAPTVFTGSGLISVLGTSVLLAIGAGLTCGDAGGDCGGDAGGDTRGSAGGVIIFAGAGLDATGGAGFWSGTLGCGVDLILQGQKDGAKLAGSRWHVMKDVARHGVVLYASL